MVLFASNILFSILEHFLSWSEEIWDAIEPCLIRFRLRGVKKVYDIQSLNNTKQLLKVEELKEATT